MNRREFFQNALKIAAAAGIVPLLSRAEMLFGAEKSSGIPEMAAVRGGDPGVMFDAGIAAFGGMSAFVKKGQTVLVKPNIGWNRPPEFAANTNPELVGRIVRHCIDAGAKKVLVFDHTCDNWKMCYASSGNRGRGEKCRRHDGSRR